MRILAVLAALMTLAVAAPARADWQYTKWGMTRDEVTAASGGRAALDSEGVLRLLDKITLAGQEFRVFFRFDDSGKLMAVMLEGDTAYYQVIDSALAAAFGPAVTRSDEGFPTYVDRAKGNQIYLSDRYVLTIIYRAVETGF
jgi:hypothetical protein